MTKMLVIILVNLTHSLLNKSQKYEQMRLRLVDPITPAYPKRCLRRMSLAMGREEKGS
jgi:hypothetical protein